MNDLGCYILIVLFFNVLVGKEAIVDTLDYGIHSDSVSLYRNIFVRIVVLESFDNSVCFYILYSIYYRSIFPM